MVTVSEIRRYPVKAMGGQSLPAATVDRRGIAGDRWFAVTDDEGHFATGKTSRRFRRHDEVFDFGAVMADEQVVVSDGSGQWTVGDPDLDRHLSARMGRAMRVLPETGVSHFDAAPLSLIGTASLEWCAQELGVDADRRRLRPNLVVQTEEPFVEDGWVGHRVRIGGVVAVVTGPTRRCRMVDVAQDGVSGPTHLLKALGARRELNLAVYLRVEQPGVITVGDEVLPTSG